MRARHPRIGGLLLALVDGPASTRVWAQGAQGEREVAARLDGLQHVTALHDRRLRRPDGRLTRANIDHLVVAPAGIWVVDAKTHRGRLEVRREGGLLSRHVERLVINGRDQTALLEGLGRQVDAVEAQLRGLGLEVPVRGALCFVGTELPWLDEDIAGVPLRGPRGVARLLGRTGPFDAEARADIAARLSHLFPPA